jgi:hypothetical protein
MGRWLAAAAPALSLVADRPTLWLPGALAWLGGFGWLPFVVAVGRPPTQSELTYFGAGLQTSGLWPLNLVLLAAAAVGIVVLAIAIASLGNAALDAALAGREVAPADVGHRFVAAMVAVLPMALAAFVLLLAVIAVAPTEFTRPGSATSAVVRVAVRVAPIAAASAIVALVAATLGDLAGRLAVRSGDVATGLLRTPGAVRRLGLAGLAHAVASLLAGGVSLVVAAALLGVLWAPIGAALGSGAAMDARTGALLVGFIGIWLCLVLVGGALHAWTSATWTGLLRDDDRRPAGAAREAPTYR